MKAITHTVFSLGIGLYLVHHVARPPDEFFLILVVWLAFAINEVIDILGHVSKGGRPVRSFWTHSVFTAPIWGIATALASAYLSGEILGQALTTPQWFFAVGLGAMLAYSHLLLDALTESGVYFMRGRVAIAHMSYDNLILNGGFAALGVLLAFAAFT